MAIQLVILDEVNIKLTGLPLDARKKLVAEFKYEIPGAKYQPAYRLGRWDGMVSLFGLGGNGYLSQLEKILEILGKMGISISEVVDERIPVQLKFNSITETYWAEKNVVWPPGHAMAGQPIMLRDYQVEVINTFIKNPQGILSICTGSGKCVSYNTELDLIIDENTEFGKYLLSNDIFHVEQIGKFIEHASKFFGKELKDNEEISINGVSIDTPYGVNPITHVIKKNKLAMLKITFDNGYVLECAKNHILRKENTDIYAKDLIVGDMLDHRDNKVIIINISSIDDNDCYDISVPSPHLYYDAAGLVHHNTITTATLSHLCEPYGKTIIIVPNKSLVEQTEEDYINCGLDVGVYYGNRKDLFKTHTICTWQSLNVLDKKSKNNEQEILSLAEFLDGVSAVIVDEAHTATSSVLQKLLTQNLGNAPIRWGLTGTIPKDPYAYESLYTSIGPIIGEGVKAKDLQDNGVLSSCHVNIMQLIEVKAFKTYADELKYLVTDVARMSYISKMIKGISDSGNTLVLVDRLQTGKLIVENIPNSVFVSGNVKTTDRKAEYDEIKVSDDKIIVATYGVAACGLNIVRIHNLIMIEPGKSFTRVIQSIGRGLRKGFDKDSVEIYDFTSTCKFSKRHITQRKKFYDESEYPYTITKVDWS